MTAIPSKASTATILLLATMLGGCAERTPAPRRGFGARHGHESAGRGERPGFGRFFVSPMGEPFRGQEGVSPVAAWFNGADTNHDGRLTSAEFAADAARFFATLDIDHDGEIDPAEIARYEKEIVPQLASGVFGGMGGGRGGDGRHGGRGHDGMGRGGMGRGGMDEGSAGGGPAAPPYVPQGAARFSFLGNPEPVVSADINFNGAVTLTEFVETAGRRFGLIDTAHQGSLTLATLPPLPGSGREGRRQPQP